MATKGTDSAWSWVIAAACCWVTFVIQGLVRSGGVVYVALIDSYAVSRAQASWPFTLRLAIWNLSGPLAGALSYRWSIRTITIIGVLLVTITNIICWFAREIYIITFFLGGLQGLGVGMAVTLVPVIINQYFSKYKSTGAGIACAGATAGSFALPPVVEFAIEEYGLGGAFLMMAGITLHGILGASLMRPAEWLSKKKPIAPDQQEKGDQNLNFLTKSHENSEMEEANHLLNENCNNTLKLSRQSKMVRFSGEFKKDPEHDAKYEDRSSFTEACKVSQCNQTLSENIQNSIESEEFAQLEHNQNFQPSEDTSLIDQKDIEILPHGKLEFIENKIVYDPQINLKPVYVPLNNDHSQKTSHIGYTTSSRVLQNGLYFSPPAAKKSPSLIKNAMEPVKAACDIVKNPMFLIIASNYSIFFLSYMTYLIIIVDYSLDLGVDRTDCVFLVSTFSIADLVGRLGSGWITDGGIVKRKHLMMVNMILVGGLLISTSFATTYYAVTAVSVCTGLVVGVNLILFYALLEEYLGLRKLPMAIGLMNFSIGVISLITPLLTGYFRDSLGSYDHLFHLLGGVSILCGLLWTLEPFLSRSKNTTSIATA